MPSLLYQAPPPLKRSLREGSLQIDDDTQIFYQYATQPQATELIILVHGYSEHSDCYLAMMNWYFKQGYHVACFDVRGHGLSSGDRGYIDHFKAYSSDLHQVITTLQQQCRPRDTHCIAHSNGGLMLCYYLLTHDKAHHFKRVVLSAPYLGTNPNVLPIQPIQWLMRRLLSVYRKLAIPTKSDGNKLTHDSTIIKKISADKKRLQTTSIAWYCAAKEAQEIVIKRAKYWPNSALLMITAEQDALADNDKLHQFFELIPIAQKQSFTPPNTFHELLNEVNREQIYQRILDWIK